jgi:drug/metabolite transporter (DMT)-like permease
VFSVLLGVLILGESLSAGGIAGMILIFSSFGVLVSSSIHAVRRPPAESPRQNVLGHLVNLGYLFGPVSALAYATGYVVRKQGLSVMPDAVFGTMVGAIAGLTAFLVASLVSERYRSDVVNAFTVFNPWLMIAGLTSSCGQICYFVALKYSTVSKIALITSMEIFLTMFLAWFLFRGSVVISRDIVAAALLGFIGTVLIITF